jgi:hypothetical protein
MGKGLNIHSEFQHVTRLLTDPFSLVQIIFLWCSKGGRMPSPPPYFFRRQLLLGFFRVRLWVFISLIDVDIFARPHLEFSIGHFLF